MRSHIIPLEQEELTWWSSLYINTGYIYIYDVPQPLSHTLVRVKTRIVEKAHDDDPPTINGDIFINSRTCKAKTYGTNHEI